MQDELQDLGWGGMEGQSSFLLLLHLVTLGLSYVMLISKIRNVFC